MTMAIPGSITGGAQTGFTSPTYTTTADKAAANANQSIVSAVGGTQTGVRVHSVSDPFTINVSKPVNPRVLPSPNPLTGKYPPLPSNRYAVVVRKGANFAANNAPSVAIARLYLDVPAGTDAFDSPNLRALCSVLVGLINQISAGMGDSLANGVI